MRTSAGAVPFLTPAVADRASFGKSTTTTSDTPVTALFDIELPAVPESATRARRTAWDALAGYSVDRDAVALAVTEAVANAAMHAYRDRPKPGHVRVAASVGPGGLRVVVSDEGVGPRRSEDSPGAGLGLRLIASLADEVEFSHDGGTRLVARFAMGARERLEPDQARAEPSSSPRGPAHVPAAHRP
jgi:anti-sigma regulatory factor (Ser/Thr protein kinase)